MVASRTARLISTVLRSVQSDLPRCSKSKRTINDGSWLSLGTGELPLFIAEGLRGQGSLLEFEHGREAGRTRSHSPWGELTYRFYLHQHPYVQPLAKRLLCMGTRGLQAADTEYVPGEISLPYGVDVELDANVQASVPDGTRIGLLGKATATTLRS